MEVRLREEPPALVGVDGSGAITRSRHPVARAGVRDGRSTREPAVRGSPVPTRVEVDRRRDGPVPAAAGAAITP
jgi:hypothetical protein